MESASLLDSSLYCCHRCKGLFPASDDKLKHQVNCMGNPMESSCAYFACERKVFLQLFQPDDFLLDGCDPPFLFSKDDSFINHFVKIRIPDIFDPSIFLKTASAFQPNQGEDTNFLIESNIDTLQEEAEKASGSTYADPSKKVDPISEDRIQSIINKNIEYLKHDDIPSLSGGRNKVDPTFSSSQSFPQLLSPIDKHLHLFGDGSKSRLQSPFERGSGFLHDGQLGYSSGNFMYSSNPSLPFSCGLSTDLFSSIPPPQEENPQTLPTNIEEFPTLQYLDLAKKDPFFGQNPGLSQINNSKDPFLINAAFKTTERPNFGLQKSQITRSCEDLQSSPTLPLQDGNYFNFSSTLDEPTQLDYLDLATLDFITNPNLISCPPINFKEKTFEKDDDIYSEDNVTCHEPTSIKSEAVARLVNTSLSDHGGSDGLSAFSRVKKKKKLRLKKSKSDIERRYENILPQNSNSVSLNPALKEGNHSNLTGSVLENAQGKNRESLLGNTEVKKSRKRRSDSPKGSKSESKLMKINRKPDKHLNVREKLTYLSEEQKDKMKAVLGQAGCIFVKKKRSLSCDEPVVYVNDSQVFGSNELLREHSGERDIKFHPIKSNSKIIFDEQCKTRKLTSVLQLKCQECDFQCRSVIELKNHRTKHIKKSEEDILEDQTIQSNQVTKVPNLVPDLQHVTDKDKEKINEQRMAYHVNASCHLEKIPEVAVVDEQVNSSHFEADMSNTFTTSLSVPFISENSEQNIYEHSVIGEVIKELDDSSRKTLNSLPITMTNVPMNFSKTEKLTEPILSEPNTSLYSNPDLNQETEMAVKTIESISSEYDKCNLNKEDIAPQYSDYIAVKIVLDDKIETNDTQGSDMEIIYGESGLDVLNMNPIEQRNEDKNQTIREEIETNSAHTTLPLFPDEQVYSESHDAEINKAYDKNLPENDKQVMEVTNKGFEDLLENERQYNESCGTSSENNVKEQAFYLKDEAIGVKMVIDDEVYRNEDQTIQTKHIDNTLNNDFINFNSTNDNYFDNLQDLVVPRVESGQDLVETRVEHLQVLVEPSVESHQDLVEKRIENNQDLVKARVKNLQDFAGPRVENCQNLVETTVKNCQDIVELRVENGNDLENQQDLIVESRVENLQDLIEPRVKNIHDPVEPRKKNIQVSYETSTTDNKNKIFDNIKDSDIILEHVSRRERDNNVKGNNVKHDVLEDSFLKEVNSFESNDMNNVKNAVFVDHSNNIEKFSQDVSDPDIGSYLDKLVDIVSSDTFECEKEHQQNNLLKNVKPLGEVCSGTICEFNAETSGASVVIIHDRSSDDFEFNSITADAIKDPLEVVSVQNDNYVTETFQNYLVSKDSANISEHTLIENDSVSDIKQEFCNDENNEAITVDISKESANTPIKVNSTKFNDCINVPTTIGDSDCNLNMPKVSNDIEDALNVPVAIDIMPIDVQETDNIMEIDAEIPKEVDVITNGSNIPVIASAINNSQSIEPKVNDTSDNDINVPVAVNTKDTTEPNSVGQTTGNQPIENKMEKHNNVFENLTIHKVDVLQKTCDAGVHQNKTHTVPNPLSKLVDGKGYKKQVKERDGYFLCDVTGCQFKTQYKSNVAAHYQHVHLAIKKYICDQCVYSTPNKSCLKHHMQLNHLKEKKYKCPECDYLSLFHSDIVKHVRHTHMKQKQYACNQCEYRTGHSHSLKLHIMSHNGIRPYKCSSCEYRANNANKVTRHIKLCHANEVGVSCIKEDLTFEIDAKQFQCEDIISYQDIKVIELTTEEADVIVKQREVKKEQEKEAKVVEKKAKEAEKKAKREIKRKEEEIANMSALNAIEKFSNVNNISRKDIKVIKLTPETAKAFMAAKVTEKPTVNSTDKLGETNRFTRILQKPKLIVQQNVKGTSLIPLNLEELNKKVS